MRTARHARCMVPPHPNVLLTNANWPKQVDGKTRQCKNWKANKLAIATKEWLMWSVDGSVNTNGGFGLGVAMVSHAALSIFDAI